MKNKIFPIAALFALLVAVSCNDMKELTDRVDNLETRVEALETLCETMNGQVVALQTFVSNNKSISKVETAADGTYTLTLSDNSTIVLKQGSEGAAVMPEIAVNNDGNWTVNGEVLKVNDQPVPATGANGATPIFGVDAEGYWTVKYAAGETPARILDAAGNPVKATTDGSVSTEAQDSFFSDVKVEGDKVVVTLKADGKSYSLPVIPDFVCSIEAPAQPIVFDAGATKSFNVTQKNVAAATLFCPAGWNASLSDNLLTVTAPAAVKSVSADTRQDVGILAISNNGFAAIAKIMVQLSDTPIVVVPTAALSAGEATQTSLSFTVTLSNASRWYYLLQKSDAEAPTAEALKAATEGSETTLTLTKDASGADLVHSTSYTLYVLPVNDTAEGSVASVENSTAEKVYATLYEKYNDGGNIVIGDKVINKASYGEATHITKDAPTVEVAKKIFFIDPDADATCAAEGLQTMILIGNKAGERSKVAFTGVQIGLGSWADTDVLIMSGIDVDASACTNYFIAQNKDGAYGYVHFNDCRITPPTGKNISYVSTAKRSYANFIMTGCEYVCGTGNSNIIIAVGSSTATYPNLKFENNIFYNPGTKEITQFRFFQGNAATVESLTIKNNTFVNVHSGNNSVVYTGTLNNVVCTKNLMFSNIAMTESLILMRATTGPTDGSKAVDNIFYKTTADGDKSKMQLYFGGYNKLPGSEDPTALSADPFTGGTFDVANGKFVPATTYAAYGAQR